LALLDWVQRHLVMDIVDGREYVVSHNEAVEELMDVMISVWKP
jgi:hypothetical protein